MSLFPRYSYNYYPLIKCVGFAFMHFDERYHHELTTIDGLTNMS